MAEYIDIDKAVLVADIRGRELKTTVRHILGMNKGIYDTDDVQPVRHGRWDDFEPDMPLRRKICSECGHIINPWLAQVFNFCPFCGARMDGET